ncbi:MAG: hypothetical protein FWC41_09030 [Firmicutes bacterium]|nr:hypothetical protein [Bacillota bacterium]
MERLIDFSEHIPYFPFFARPEMPDTIWNPGVKNNNAYMGKYGGKSFDNDFKKHVDNKISKRRKKNKNRKTHN